MEWKAWNGTAEKHPYASALVQSGCELQERPLIPPQQAHPGWQHQLVNHSKMMLWKESCSQHSAGLSQWDARAPVWESGRSLESPLWIHRETRAGDGWDFLVDLVLYS